MKRFKFATGMLISSFLLSACGIIEVGVEDQTEEPLSPASTAIVDEQVTAEIETAMPVNPTEESETSSEMTTAEPPLAATEVVDQPNEETGSNPPGWLRYQNEDIGIEFLHPPETYVEEREPSSPVTWNESLPDGLVEEQLYSAIVYQDIEQENPPANRQAILEIKLVANPTVSVHLMGYRYTCEGMMPFTEFWALFGDHTDIIFSAAWAEMFSPLSDDILATVTFTQ
jgi:hypothetical protein